MIKTLRIERKKVVKEVEPSTDGAVPVNRAALWKLIVDNKHKEVYVQLKLEREQLEQKTRKFKTKIVHWTDDRGQTALHIACLCNAVRTAEILLDFGSNFYVFADNGSSPETCVVDPDTRQALKQKAFDTSPEGIAFRRAEWLRNEQASEARETSEMENADAFSLAREDYIKEQIAYWKHFHELSRAKLVAMFIEKGMWLAQERLMTNAAMEVSEFETRAAEEYKLYLAECEAERLRIEAEEAAAYRAKMLAEAMKRAEEENRRIRLAKERKARIERLIEERRLAAEAKRKAEEEAEAAAATAKYKRFLEECERIRKLTGIRAAYDKPRRIRLYERMRLAVQVSSCNNLNYGGKSLNGPDIFRDGREEDDEEDGRRSRGGSRGGSRRGGRKKGTRSQLMPYDDRSTSRDLRSGQAISASVGSIISSTQTRYTRANGKKKRFGPGYDRGKGRAGSCSPGRRRRGGRDVEDEGVEGADDREGDVSGGGWGRGSLSDTVQSEPGARGGGGPAQPGGGYASSGVEGFESRAQTAAT